MVDVSSSKNSITITVGNTNKNNSVAITPGTANNSITTKSDTAQYWSNLSRDYSEQAKTSAYKAEQVKNEIITQKDGVIAEIEEIRTDAVSNIVTKSESTITELKELKEISEQEISVAVADGLTEINKKKNTAISDLEFVSEGEKDEIKDLANLIKENAEDIVNRTSFAMFDTILKDHILTYEESKGLALQGTYVYKEAVAGSRYGYADFYNKCLEEYNTSEGIEWTQPVLTSNTTIVNEGTITVTVNGAYSDGNAGYKVFDGDNTSTYWSVAGVTGYLQIKFPYKLAVTGLTFYQKGGDVGTKEAGFYTSSDLSTPIGDTFTASQTNYGATVVSNIPTEGIITDTIYLDVKSSYGSYIGASEIKITAKNLLYKVNPNGHIFYDIADKNIVDELFNSTGSAWFYGVDTENERIFLPRNNYFEQMTGDVSEVGQSVEAGLPNITGYTDAMLTGSGSGISTGALHRTITGTGGNGGGNYARNMSNITFDASRSSSVYKDDVNTVQPNAVKKLLYICVGNQVQDTSWVDVVTQVKNGAKDIDDVRVQALTDLTNKENAGLSALSNASNALRQTQITNCLLEVPQNIKVELSDNSLTLKAGSKVIVPNGFEADGTTKKFDEVTVKSDLVLNQTANGTCTLYLTNGKKIIAYSGKPISGETDPEAGKVAYNTTSNIVKRINSSGTEVQLSFPIATIVMSDTTVTSIEETFNGFGYIGSTIWVDKGVKGLIPKGRNADGSLNNIEFVTENIITRTMSGDVTRDAVLGLNSNSIGRLYFNDYSFDYEDNYIRNAAASAEWSYAIIGTYNDAKGVISNFNPKLPFRAVDYQEAVLKDSLQEVQCVIETYTNGTSWYRLWSDGWCEQGGEISVKGNGNTTVTLLQPYSNAQYTANLTGIWSSNDDYIFTVINRASATFQIHSSIGATVPFQWSTAGYTR